MSCIEKTYVTSLKDYKEIIEWCKHNSFVCPNNMRLDPMNYCLRGYTDEEIKKWLKESKAIPVMCTSRAMDYFLIKCCPIEAVQNRLKEAYSEEYYNAVKNGTSVFDKWRRGPIGRHYRFIKKPYFNWCHKLYSKTCRKYIRASYWVDAFIPKEDGYAEFMSYNEHYKQWLFDDELGYWTCSTAHIPAKTMKACLRQVMKMGLPVGVHVRITGRFVGDECEIVITK